MEIPNTQYYQSLNLKGELVLLDRPWIMGIVNITPDSFFASSRTGNEYNLVKNVEQMLIEGADIIDIGGQSTRPGAAVIDEEAELERVIPAISAIAKHFPDARISVDTFYGKVAGAAAEHGACMINDVSGGMADKAMFDVAAKLNMPYVLMHRGGENLDLHTKTDSNDIISDVVYWFSERLEQLRLRGVKDIIVDPGFGFGKTLKQNYELLAGLKHLEMLNKPVLAGISRKSMVWKLLGSSPDEALNGTTALHMLALNNGAAFLRVHDVKAALETVKLYQLYRNPAAEK